MVLGCLSLAVGAAGIVLPVLPSTIFFILAAGCFARSSPRLERKILDHPTVGPPVRAWREHGAIPVNAKIYAITGMTVGFGLFYWSLAPTAVLTVLVGGSMVVCAIFVLTRPNGPRRAKIPDGAPKPGSAPNDP
ncbi:hypothetical protein GCM10011316_37670 [Roseibium aquae]|uniref:DUF454 domain-containing protein n=1 Tax=Roseibium aquae TaxID=1323746 RepID=A0A916TMT1_9HYPH|nr:YbaN family protein [Roseibium aquae]GGB62178.1 hypothetical protein GCM10011316_37670 [Roseibium aquae]